MEARYKEKQNTKRSDLLGQQTDFNSKMCSRVKRSNNLSSTEKSGGGHGFALPPLLCGGILAWAGLRNMV